ncbi:MAG: ribonuclease P protein component [Patescibacteria group bacterium]
MLAREFRLTKESDFKKILKTGKKDKSRFFRICFFKNNLDSSRFAVVASLKISKKSTKRNYLKRQVREIIRLKSSELKGHYDVVVSILPNALKKKYADLGTDLISLFKRNELIS